MKKQSQPQIDFDFARKSISDDEANPPFRKISQALAAWIREEKLGVGAKMPSISLLAEKFHVSTRTMFKAEQELLDAGLCYRHPKKGTFVGQEKSPELNVPDNVRKVVLLYVPSFGLDYFNTDQAEQRLYFGMRQEAEQRDIGLVLVNGGLKYYLANDSLDIQGVILLKSVNMEELAECARLYPQKRFVLSNYFINDFEMMPDNVLGVFNDDFGGAYMIADYFLEKGCRNCVILNAKVPEDDNYLHRVEGYRLVMANYQSNVEEHTIPRLTFSWQQAYDFGYSITEMLLRKKDKLDLILSVTDTFSQGCYDALEAAGRKDIILTGYDGYHFVGRPRRFPTMAINFEKIGAISLRLAVTRNVSPRQIRVFPNFLNYQMDAEHPEKQQGGDGRQ